MYVIKFQMNLVNDMKTRNNVRSIQNIRIYIVVHRSNCCFETHVDFSVSLNTNLVPIERVYRLYVRTTYISYINR